MRSNQVFKESALGEDRADRSLGLGRPAFEDETVTEIITSDDPAVRGAPEPGELQSGDSVGRWVIDAPIAWGGGGTVYSAHDSDGQAAAVKVMRADLALVAGMVVRFKREVEAVTRVAHKSIIKIFDFGELLDGRPYYAMELLTGGDLRQLLRKHGRLSPAEIVRLLTPICEAVQAAHDAGIIHRDIKASNIFVGDSEGRPEMKLLDFGIAKAIAGEGANEGLTEPGTSLGTTYNMAPEQIRCSPVDERTDIYALGVLVYELATGRYPFEDPDPRRVALLHVQAPAPAPSELAPAAAVLDPVVARCLNKRPADRYESVGHFLAELRVAAGVGRTLEPGRAAMSVGVHCVITVSSHSDHAELDDEVLDDVCDVIDTVEEALNRCGFLLPLRTSSSLLGVRALEAGAGPHVPEDVTQIVAELRELLDDREGAHPSVGVSLDVAVGEAVYASDDEVTGGALLDMKHWMTKA